MVSIRKRNLRWGDIDMAEMELNKLIIHFAQSNKAEGKSLKTITWYTDILTSFTRFLVASYKRSVIDEFNVVAVREFIIHEQDRGLSPYSVHGKVRALKCFASWLKNENYTPEHVLQNLKPPKVPVNLIEPLTNKEIEQLLSCQNQLTALGCRNISILVTLLDTGIRLNELCMCHYEDAHIDDGYLKVMGKGAKERIVPIGGLAQKMLWRYVIHFRPEPLTETGGYLFLAADGKPMSSNAVKLLLRRWGRKAGVSRLHAHLCRHTYATNFLIHNCGDIFRLQQILGHTTLEMVRRYVHFASAQAMISGKPTSPMDHMDTKMLTGYKIERILRNSSKIDNVTSHNAGVAFTTSSGIQNRRVKFKR